MSPDANRALLLEDYKGFLSILDQKGVAFTPPFKDEELKTLELSDLKRLVATARDLARTPTGQ